MLNRFSASGRRILERAEASARRLRHEYIGTEHILLGLIEDATSGAADALAVMGATPSRVLEEVERMVLPGPHPVTVSTVPLTPRAARVVELASDEARHVHQDRIGPEHLLLGLTREPDGVAAIVLRNLGVQPDRLRREVLRIRLSQMVFVERAVRPLRTSIARRRRMREELLAHLTAIYDQELERARDRSVALDEAKRRFGDPNELSSELQRALSWRDRIGFWIEWLFGWRAPESAIRYVFRQAVLSWCLIAIATVPFVLLAVIELPRAGWSYNIGGGLRILAGVLSLPILQFIMGVSYFRIRDGLFGVFGSRKSTARALGYTCIVAVAIAAWMTCLLWLARADVREPIAPLLPALVAVVVAGCHLLTARLHGPGEIRDTIWATLDVKPPPPFADAG